MKLLFFKKKFYTPGGPTSSASSPKKPSRVPIFSNLMSLMSSAFRNAFSATRENSICVPNLAGYK